MITEMEWYNVRLLIGKQYRTIKVFAKDVPEAIGSAIFQGRVANRNASIVAVSVWKEGEPDEFLENLMHRMLD